MTCMAPPLLRRAALLLIVGVVSTSAGSGLPCPQECRCSSQDSIFTARCTSLSFIQKLSPKEYTNILSLDVSNASISTLDKILVRKLVNLERLNLSHNKLSNVKHFPQLPKLTHLNLRSNFIKLLSGKQLPSKLEVLDISQNYIRELPPDLVSLKHLKRLYLGGNVFSCSRDSLDVRDALLDHKVKIIGRPYCSSPPKFHGKPWLHVVDLDEYLKLHGEDDMQADDAGGSGDAAVTVDGSGDGDVFANVHISSTVAPDEEPEPDEKSDFTFVEGSGEGSEEIVPSEEPMPEEVTTMEPIVDYDEETEDDEGSGSAAPVTFKSDDEYHQVTDNLTSTTDEPVVVTRKTVQVFAMPKPTEEAEVAPTTEGSPDSHVEASKTDESSIGTNIFLVLVVICLVLIIVYWIKKRKERSQRRPGQKSEDPEKQATDIELLPKAALVNDKQNGNAESTPLMNGQNGEADRDMETDMGADEKSAAPHPGAQDVLSVKVRASEIPDSIPRTPILVDRRKASDGQNIVVTPNLNQRISTGD